jgi:tetratricopeptide (TPR) repeat protein
MNTLPNLLFVLSCFTWINLAAPAANAQPWARSQTASTESRREQQSVENKGQEQTQTAEAETLLATAADLYRKRNFDDALTNCLKASTLNPQDHRPYVLAGYIYMAKWKMRSASEAFAQAIQLRPKSKELYLLKATADEGRVATEDAIAACQKALELDPGYAEAYEEIGDVLQWNEKRRSEAIAAYNLHSKLTLVFS